MITHTEKTLEETTTAIHQFRFRRFALNNSRAGMRNRGLGARQTIAAPLMVPLDNNKHEPGEGKKKKGWGGEMDFVTQREQNNRHLPMHRTNLNCTFNFIFNCFT